MNWNEYFSESVVTSLIGVVALLAVEYVGVFGAAMADLRSGLLKARRAGKKCTSGGFRRTVDKLARYYVTLIAMTFIDAMIVVAALYLRHAAGWNIPPFPLFTTIGAIGLSIIELKSIYETSDDKGDYTEALNLLKRLLRDREFMDLLKR